MEFINKECVCGRSVIKCFEVNKGKKIALCPLCAFYIYKEFRENLEKQKI